MNLIFEIGREVSGLVEENHSIENKKLAILVHGYGADHYQMSPYAKMFEKNGYDILAIDVRCHGKSGGIYQCHGRKADPEGVCKNASASEGKHAQLLCHSYTPMSLKFPRDEN